MGVTLSKQSSPHFGADLDLTQCVYTIFHPSISKLPAQLSDAVMAKL